MSFVVDTNVLSELRKPIERADANVQAWVRSVPHVMQFLSVVTILEIEVGVARVERRDPRQGGALRRWFEDRVLVEFEARILPIDMAIARETARMHVPDPRPERDAFIAATARVHGMTVVTRNVADFAPLGVPVVNPWD
ncbi:type II toxin-antitoxin system VapC family toxin [Mumia sp. DW29H23]|uniref:type II toxin-antitoxin system VapC family toxin n=1 Tax=Mumia sp. DW29H23 TaxID=3421241 RepID=UPI003D697BDC